MKTLRSAKEIVLDIERFFGRSVDAVRDDINKLAKAKTPVRTGRARRGWTRRENYRLGKNRPTIIENKVPYIGILDKRVKIINPSAERAVYINNRRTNR